VDRKREEGWGDAIRKVSPLQPGTNLVRDPAKAKAGAVAKTEDKAADRAAVGSINFNSINFQQEVVLCQDLTEQAPWAPDR
jgi:hypothetical protein